MKRLVVLIVLALVALSGAVWADSARDGFSVGGVVLAGGDGIEGGIFLPFDLKLYTPNNECLGFYDSVLGDYPLAFQGLRIEAGLTTVGIMRVKAVKIAFVRASDVELEENASDDVAWLDCVPMNGMRWVWRGNLDELAWGANTVLYRVEHTDNHGKLRLVLIKISWRKAGSTDMAFRLGVQLRPPDWMTMVKEEIFKFLRGFIPAWATKEKEDQPQVFNLQVPPQLSSPPPAVDHQLDEQHDESPKAPETRNDLDDLLQDVAQLKQEVAAQKTKELAADEPELGAKYTLWAHIGELDVKEIKPDRAVLLDRPLDLWVGGLADKAVISITGPGYKPWVQKVDLPWKTTLEPGNFGSVVYDFTIKAEDITLGFKIRKGGR